MQVPPPAPLPAFLMLPPEPVSLPPVPVPLPPAFQMLPPEPVSLPPVPVPPALPVPLPSIDEDHEHPPCEDKPYDYWNYK